MNQPDKLSPINKKLQAVRFSEQSALDRQSFAVHEYIMGDAQVAAEVAFAKERGFEAFDSIRDIEMRKWDRQTSLNGKRCLIAAVGGIGDTLALTALLSEAKRRYPASRWSAFCASTQNSAVFQSNPNIDGMMAQGFPVPLELWEKFDYHFIPLELVGTRTDKEQPNFYEILFSWMFGDVPDRKLWRPEVFIRPDENEGTIKYLMNYGGSLTVNHIVIQINSSKDNRNPPIRLLIDTIHALQRTYPDKYIYLFGEGEYAVEFARALEQESFYLIPGTYIAPNGQAQRAMFTPFRIFFTSFDGKTEIPQNFSLRFKEQGNVGNGQVGLFPNMYMNLRGIACIMREAFCVIAPDSSFNHLAAAIGIQIPSVALFGAFDPACRVSTYEDCLPIFHKKVCDMAPCFYHFAGFPEGCPTIKPTGIIEDGSMLHELGYEAGARAPHGKYCEVMNAITPSDILEAIEEVTR